MRWSTSLGAWARRETVLVSALAAGAAMAALGGWLDATWLMTAGGIVAAAGAVARLGIAIRRARLEGEVERAQLGRLVRVGVASIGDVDPTLIGIDRAEQAILPGGVVPDYVRRVADGQLREAVTGALDGRGPWMIVVEGPSKVGKSRSLFEALRESARSRPLQLVAPVSVEALRLLLTPGQGLRAASGAAVLWLDDLEPFLNEGMTIQTLREWHTAAPARIVAATYGGKGSELIAGSPASGLATTASAVLQHARRIPLQATTAGELAALRPHLHGAEAASLERHGLAAYVVAGPALETKLNTGRHAPGHDACPEGLALVYAAVDWTRCGRTDPIAHDTMRRLWPSYLPPGVPATDDRFETALAWALKPVVDGSSIALVQHTGSYEAFDYVVRLVRDKQDAEPPRDAAWAAALDTATDAQALAVATSAFFQERNDIALDALARARTSSVEAVAARAGFNLGVVLGQLDRVEEAIGVFDEVVSRYGYAIEPALREEVARALILKGFALRELDRFEEAIGVYDELVARFGDASEPALREQVARGLVNKCAALEVLGRVEEELGVYNELVARFGDASEPALREEVARALGNKGSRLGVLGRVEEELGVYNELVARFGDATESALREEVARALGNKGSRLGALGRVEEELVVYNELVARFGDATELALRERVATVLVNKGVALAALGRLEDAVGVYDELVARFGDATEPALRERVARALIFKGFALRELDRSEEAIGVYDELVARFGDASEPALREQVARALRHKGFRLGALRRVEEELVVYDELVARFGDAIEPALREEVARALVDKGFSLMVRGRFEDAVGVYDELVARFGDATEPALREHVASARQVRRSLRLRHANAMARQAREQRGSD